MIRKLKEVMPIKRTNMLLRIFCNAQGISMKTVSILRNVCFCLDKFADLQLYLFAEELPVRLQLTREGATILSNATTSTAANSIVGSAAESSAPTSTSNSSVSVSIDFEIEPDAYRAVEALVKSMAAGRRAAVLYIEGVSELLTVYVICHYYRSEGPRVCCFSFFWHAVLNNTSLFMSCLSEGVRMEVLQLRTGHSAVAGAGASAVTGAGVAVEEGTGTGDHLSAALAKSCSVAAEAGTCAVLYDSEGDTHQSQQQKQQLSKSLGSSNNKNNNKKKEGLGRARLSSGGSGSEGDDILAHIAVAPSLTVRLIATSHFPRYIHHIFCNINFDYSLYIMRRNARKRTRRRS